MACDLCKAATNDALWVDGNFYGLICRTCHVPMVIAVFHRSWLTLEEKSELDDIVQRRLPGHFPRGRGMRDIPGHFHEHYIPER